MTEPAYDMLSRVLDVFMDEFGGRQRIRGIQTILLLREASLAGHGINISEVRRVTGAPLENIRRHFSREMESGNLTARADPDDERMTRYLVADPDGHNRSTRRVVTRLHDIGAPDDCAAAEPRPIGRETYAALNDVLQVFIDTLNGSTRIRGFKVAIVIQKATLDGRGVTVSELAREVNAPLETVRRALQPYIEDGTLQLEEDPNDDRATRMRYTDPAGRARIFEHMADRLSRLDWRAFNTR